MSNDQWVYVVPCRIRHTNARIFNLSLGLMPPRYHGSGPRMEEQDVIPCSQGLSAGKCQGSIDRNGNIMKPYGYFYP
jgi:hypothetical protein